MILATYAKPRVWFRIALLASLLLLVPVVTIAVYRHHPPPGSPNLFLPAMTILLWILAIPTARALKAIVDQVVFHGARLIWIENGQLIWRDPKFFSLTYSNIAKITCGTGGRFSQLDTITFDMRDGTQKIISTDAMAENCDDVAQRLRQHLACKIS